MDVVRKSKPLAQPKGFHCFPVANSHLSSRADRIVLQNLANSLSVKAAGGCSKGSHSSPQGNMHPILRAGHSLITSLNPMLMHSGPPGPQPLSDLHRVSALSAPGEEEVTPALLPTCGLLPNADSMKSVPLSLLLVGSFYFVLFSSLPSWAKLGQTQVDL